MTVSIYGCGGAGINVTSAILIDSTAPGFAKFVVNQVDTSKANLNGSSHVKNQHHIAGLDGAGGDRRYAMKQCEPQIDTILQKYQPTQFNIVVFSLAGGSGSVIGPLIARELMRRNANVVCLVVGNLTNGKESGNTLAGIATLQGISKQATVPMPVSFFFNTKETPMSVVDESIIKMVRALLVLNSGDNLAMDSRDVHNWINYHERTTVPAQLVSLEILAQRDGEEVSTKVAPIATLSLLLDKSTPQLDVGQVYGKTAWIAESVRGSTKEPKSLHYLLSNSGLQDLFNQLAETNVRLKESEAQLTAINVKSLGESDDDSGFVF